jgi:SAM-dependent methyltransferase
MDRAVFTRQFRSLFESIDLVEENFAVRANVSDYSNQRQTNSLFSEKWAKYETSTEKDGLYEFQRRWYLKLYGFDSEDDLRNFLQSCAVVFDAGSGLGFKAAWFAELAPQTLVIGMDFSESARHAAHTYSALPNLFFIQGDIVATGILAGAVDYISCDQVIMHTQDPERTFAELTRVARLDGGQIACYFYAKKALPRELIDDYFRIQCTKMDRKQLWEMSEQLAELGKRLSDLNVEFESPAIPALGIRAGTYNLQRFIYWNFLKCFWNAELGLETSIVTNFDWYGPSNARRFSEREIRDIVAANDLTVEFFHSEEACHSGRFMHPRR